MQTLEKTSETREFSLDLIRAVAAAQVPAIHFFLNTDFYNTPLQGGAMLLAAWLRMACMTAVPLFMTLTGYLCGKHRWSWRYYRKILPVLLTYLLAACACLFFQIGIRGDDISPLSAVRRLLDFSAAPYGWYVEMYIGLFLLIPFLNAMWDALGEKERGVLLLSLVVITSLPTLTNLFGQILPDWWIGIYPLTHYVLGAWLREHPVRLKRRWLLAGWLGLAAAAAGLEFAVARGGIFSASDISMRNSLFALGETVCLFSLLRRCKGTGCPRAVRRCLSRVARLSMPMYLISYITDQTIYPILRAARPTAASRLPFFPLMVAINLIVSGVMAQVIDWAVRAVMKLVPGGQKVSV